MPLPGGVGTGEVAQIGGEKRWRSIPGKWSGATAVGATVYGIPSNSPQVSRLRESVRNTRGAPLFNPPLSHRIRLLFSFPAGSCA